jgi:hypothetical protein
MILLEQKRAEGVLTTPPPALTTTRKDRAMADTANTVWIDRNQTYCTPIRHGACRGSGRPERLYEIWLSIRKRVFSPRDKAFARYGGRGIKFAIEWDDYSKFREWSLANGYTAGLTLDRIDNDGPYHPENCRWVDYKTQARNTRANCIFTYRGKTACLATHAEEAGLPYPPVYQRVALLGWPIDQALETPIKIRTRREP